MTMALRFDGRVAIVTGAGRGIGRAYALELARRGAKVVVNDPGVETDGSGGGKVADEVVAMIRETGGEAVAHYGSVADHAAADDLIAQAIRSWGKLDILINNAGIVRDRSFLKKDLSDFHAVVNVHLWGTVYCTHAAWKHMYEQRYGRIVVTTSGSGTLGNFGQADYGAAKMAVLGLMNCLAIEGERRNVRINSIKPAAVTRIVPAGTLSPSIAQQLRPELIVPATLYLCTEQAPNGWLLQATGGHFSRVIFAQGPGVDFSGDVSLEDFAAAWDRITDMSVLEPARHQETT